MSLFGYSDDFVIENSYSNVSDKLLNTIVCLRNTTYSFHEEEMSEFVGISKKETILGGHDMTPKVTVLLDSVNNYTKVTLYFDTMKSYKIMLCIFGFICFLFSIFLCSLAPFLSLAIVIVFLLTILLSVCIFKIDSKNIQK